jgi:NAD(P)-dependent dehydrogenase (short-subunit alcohol dehydrogenase family)
MSEQVVWITGAGSGVGAATARLFAQTGARLFLSDRNAERVRLLKEELSDSNKNIHVFIGDLRYRDTARQTGDLIAQTAQRLDLLVNCVGYNVPNRHWSEVDPKSVDDIVQTNLLAPFYCSLAALSIMRIQRSGTLVHISSTDGLRVGAVGGPAYSTSKHGVVAMSHSINLEEGANGIRSCVICPGGIDTGFLDHRAVPATLDQRAKLLRAEDVADVIRYVAGAAAHVRIEQVTMTPAPRRNETTPDLAR